MRRLVTPLVAAALLLVACRVPESPADRYRRFVDAARKGRAADVYAMLSTGSRKALAVRARALQGEKPSPGVDISAFPDLVLGDLAPTAPHVKSVTVLRESKNAAVVSVEDASGARGEVSLVREGGEWRVVLPEG